jgi:hypothetical protein
VTTVTTADNNNQLRTQQKKQKKERDEGKNIRIRIIIRRLMKTDRPATQTG